MATPLLRRAPASYIALSGAANVIMQLSWPEIGYGVKDSPVHEGNLLLNPARRRRTTLGYLAVAIHGTAEERAAYRRATTRSHAQVRSPPGASPSYHALDPELQRWVAACIFRGFEESYESVHGPLGAHREPFYREAVIFGAMLQMPPELWPPDRGAFGEYWRDGLTRVSIDASVRELLMKVVRLDYLPAVPRPVADRREWLTAGYLPREFREAMGLSWTAGDQGRFERFDALAARVIRALPAAVQGYPLNAALRDVRRRMRSGTPLF